MQTLNTVPSTSPIASSRNADSFFTPEKPPTSGDPFGDVMDRALNETNDQRRPPDRNEATQPDNLIQSTFINRTDSEDDNSTENSSEILARKNKRARSDDKQDAPNTANAAFVAMAGQPPVASSPAPSTELSGKGSTQNGPDASNPILNPQAAKAERSGHASSATSNHRTTASGQPDSEANGIKPKAGQPATETSDAEKPNVDSRLQSAATSDNSPDTTVAAAESHPQSAEAKGSAPITGSPPDARGISAAKQDMTMKKIEKTQKVAAPAEQDLPGTATAGSEELPMGQKLSAGASAHVNSKLESSAMTGSPAANSLSPTESTTVTASTEAASPTTSIDSRVLERTHDIVALHAMRLSEFGGQSLHVVVKPGNGIQLSLELHQGQNGVEVRASLHKGDFDQLNQHWPELQQRLEARGVRVSTLTTSENFSATSQHQFNQSKQQTSQDDPLYAGAFAEFALAGSVTEASGARAARASAYRGWETWA